MAICLGKILEIPIVLVFIACLLTSPIDTNLIIYRSCYVLLDYNQTECAMLGKKSSDPEIMKLEKLVEPTAMFIQMTFTLVQNIISSIICLFVGPWSDRFGRKPILISPLIGLCIGFFMNSIYCLFPNISPWYLILCSIPALLFGGMTSYFTVMLAYITDITSQENRGMRMGTLEAAITFGSMLGSVGSSYLFYATNYAIVYLTSGCIMLSAVLYTMFLVPESLEQREHEGWLKGFFQISNLKQMFITTFKQRPSHDRLIIFSAAVILIVYIMTTMGDSSVLFLYMRAEFGWSLKKYTLYNCFTSFLWVVGSTLGIYILSRVLKIQESILILFGCIFSMIGDLLLGFAKSDWWLYASGATKPMHAILGPMVRSLISKTVSSADVGKIFCFFITCEMFFNIAASPIYTAIYNATLNIYPGAFAFVTAAASLFMGLLTIMIIVIRWKNQPNYNVLVENEIQRTS